MQKTILTITDMHCVNCAMRLQSLEDDLLGVKSVNASYRNGKMIIEYDESRVSLEMIIDVVKAMGYTAVED